MAKNSQIEQIKELAMQDLWFFAKLINPHYCYGPIHEEVFRWFGADDDNERKLCLIPRAHLKSHMIATYCVWRITQDPTCTFVYLSAGEELATAQIYAMKNMLTSDAYRKFWPEMLKEREGEREYWSAFGFNVDHPARKERGIRDRTMLVRTVGSNGIGLHCDEVIFDDIVVPRYAYTEVGRRDVNRAVAQYSSILNPGGKIRAVGTRYHPDDAYRSMIEATYQVWNEEGGYFEDEQEALWDIVQHETENNGDGTGNFIWPRTVDSASGKSFGFNQQELAKIKADYLSKGERAQFFAQYYNEPNDLEGQRVDTEHFQYYDRKHIKVEGNRVYMKEKRLNVSASMDVAWTVEGRSDYTAIAVCGIDEEGMIYVLDLTQFKTNNYQKYYDEVISLYRKWGFKKLVVETNSGGKLVAEELKRYVRQAGDNLIVEGRHVAGNEGKKFERHAAIVEPRYMSHSVWHYQGGWIPTLEDQIRFERPQHDDLVDALCACFTELKAPGKWGRPEGKVKREIITNRRFGGRRRA